MYISAEGAQAQIKRMEVLSNNLANVNTPGFKRDVTTFQARFAEAVEQGLVSPGAGGPEDVGGGVMLHNVRTDYSLGGMKTTGRPTDMAIAGKGFFQVRTDEGVFLTRAGNFSIGAGGRLETEQGHPVLNANGEPITLAPGWRLTADGAIEQPGERGVYLALVRPDDNGALIKRGDNLFESRTPVKPLPADERRVRGGTLETSGVNSTTAMMELIQTSRAIEANMKLIQNQDNMLGSLVNRVLRR
jgi:flagellar basal body rod protein FlgG